MKLSFQETIEKSLSLVSADPQHDLKAGIRCQLMMSFDESAEPNPHIGHLKRVKLAIMTVQKVLPLWESSFGTDRTPHLALELAKKVVANEVTALVAETEMGKLWTYFDNLSCKHESKQTVIMIGYGAVQTVREALSKKHFGCERMDDACSDLDIDPYDHDSAFCATVAYCHGPTWESRSDSQKRFEFWTWWLKAALSISKE
jgi:hypothetical protein